MWVVGGRFRPTILICNLDARLYFTFRNACSLVRRVQAPVFWPAIFVRLACFPNMVNTEMGDIGHSAHCSVLGPSSNEAR